MTTVNAPPPSHVSPSASSEHSVNFTVASRALISTSAVISASKFSLDSLSLLMVPVVPEIEREGKPREFHGPMLHPGPSSSNRTAKSEFFSTASFTAPAGTNAPWYERLRTNRSYAGPIRRASPPTAR